MGLGLELGSGMSAYKCDEHMNYQAFKFRNSPNQAAFQVFLHEVSILFFNQFDDQLISFEIV